MTDSQPFQFSPQTEKDGPVMNNIEMVRSERSPFLRFEPAIKNDDNGRPVNEITVRRKLAETIWKIHDAAMRPFLQAEARIINSVNDFLMNKQDFDEKTWIERCIEKARLPAIELFLRISEDIPLIYGGSEMPSQLWGVLHDDAKKVEMYGFAMPGYKSPSYREGRKLMFLGNLSRGWWVWIWQEKRLDFLLFHEIRPYLDDGIIPRRGGAEYIDNDTCDPIDAISSICGK